MRLLLSFLFLSLHVCAFPQKKLISGKIIDSLARPLANQTITLCDKNSGLVVAFINTTKSGDFHFEIESDSTYNLILQIDSKFHKRFIENIIEPKNYYLIKLIAQNKELPPVEVKSSQPLIKKTGDTLHYKLNAFANNNDRVIADILPKIPGVEVGENGIIKYKGMPISNFFIDGDNVLDKRYNIATNNISKDVIDEIQILENNQPIKVLEGISITHNAAMNITFKKGYKGKVISNFNLGAGVRRLIEFEYNQLILKDKLKGINFLKYNNTGIDYLADHTTQDVSELRKQLEVNWNEKLCSLNTVVAPPIKKFRYNINSNLASSVNLFYKLKKEEIIKANFFMLFDRNELTYQNATSIYLPNANFSYRENQYQTKKPNIYYAEFVFNRNRKKTYINNQLIAEFSNTNNYSTLLAAIQMNQILKEQNCMIQNELKLIKRVHIGLLNFNSYTEWNRNPQTLFISSGILKNLLNDSINYEQTQQHADNNIFFTKNQLSYGLVKQKFKYNFKLGNIFVERENTTYLLIKHNDTLFSSISNKYFNNSNSRYWNSFLSIEFIYEAKKQKIEFDFEPALLNAEVNSNGVLKKYRNIFAVNTSLSVKQQIGRESNLRLMYSFKTEPAQIGNIFENMYLTSYRSFFKNPLPYLPESRRSVYFSYNFQRSLQLLFVNLSISKTTSSLEYIFNNDIKPSYNTVSYSLQNNKQSIVIANASISKYLFSLKSAIGLKMGYTNRLFFVLQNSNIIDYKSSHTQISFNFRPKISDFIQFNTEFSYTQFYTATNSYNGSIPKILRIENTSGFDFIVSNNLSFKLNGEFVNIRNSRSTNSSFNNFFDLSAKYIIKSKAVTCEFKLLNFLNNQAYSIQQTDINFLQRSEYSLRPLSFFISTHISL